MRDKDMHAYVALSGLGEPGPRARGPDIGGRVAVAGGPPDDPGPSSDQQVGSADFDPFYRAHHECRSPGAPGRCSSRLHGEAVIVLAGAPSSTLSASGSQLAVSDASGAALATVPLQVDATAPVGPSALPWTLTAAGQGAAPADAQAATQAITQAFEAVFNCATPPIQRVEQIRDGSLVAGALEQLDTGPDEALASSTYIVVNQVVFESPTLADVSYVLKFHSDAGLTFPMIGQAVIVSGAWRVSYGTICAAVQLGLGNCQS